MRDAHTLRKASLIQRSSNTVEFRQRFRRIICIIGKFSVSSVEASRLNCYRRRTHLVRLDCFFFIYMVSCDSLISPQSQFFSIRNTVSVCIVRTISRKKIIPTNSVGRSISCNNGLKNRVKSLFQLSCDHPFMLDVIFFFVRP